MVDPLRAGQLPLNSVNPLERESAEGTSERGPGGPRTRGPVSGLELLGASPALAQLAEALKKSGLFSDEDIGEVTQATKEQDLQGFDASSLAQLVEMLAQRLQPGQARGAPQAGSTAGAAADRISKGVQAARAPGQPMVRAPNGGGSGVVGKAYRDYQQKLSSGQGQMNPAARAQMEKQLQEKVNIGGRTVTKDQLAEEIAQKANLPKDLVTAIWKREDDSMSTNVYLHNGDPLGAAVQHEPKDVPVFGKDQFVDAAVHALGQKGAVAQQLGLSYGSTDRAAMATFAEAYNGFGTRMKTGGPSSYVMSNTQGMWVADHQFDPNKRDPRHSVLDYVGGA